jgi:hypothetical protein
LRAERRKRLLARIEKRKGPDRKMTLAEFVQYMNENRELTKKEILAERGFASFEEMAKALEPFHGINCTYKVIDEFCNRALPL